MAVKILAFDEVYCGMSAWNVDDYACGVCGCSQRHSHSFQPGWMLSILCAQSIISQPNLLWGHSGCSSTKHRNAVIRQWCCSPFERSTTVFNSTDCATGLTALIETGHARHPLWTFTHCALNVAACCTASLCSSLFPRPT